MGKHKRRRPPAPPGDRPRPSPPEPPRLIRPEKPGDPWRYGPPVPPGPRLPSERRVESRLAPARAGVLEAPSGVTALPPQGVAPGIQPIETPNWTEDMMRRASGGITHTDMEGNVIGPPGQPGDPVTVGGPISGGPAQVTPGQAAGPPIQESLWGTDFDQYQQQWFEKIMAPAQNALAARGMGAAGGSEFQHATARAGAESALIAWQARMEERKLALAERAQQGGEKISRAQLNLQREQLRQSYRMFIKELDYNSYWKYVSGAVNLASTMAPDVREWGPPIAAAQRAAGGR